MKINKEIKKHTICLNLELKDIHEDYLYTYHSWRTEYIELGELISNLSKDERYNFSDRIFTTEIDLYNTDISINDIEFDNVNLASGDNIYIVPGTDLPRYKIREKGKEVGFNIKRDVDKSNVVIFDKNIFKKLNRWYSSGYIKVNYTVFREYIKNHGIDPSFLFSEDQISLLEDDPTDVFYISNIARSTVNFDDLFNEFIYEYVKYYPLKPGSPEIECYDLLENLVNNQKIVLNSSEVLQDLNSSVILTEKTYNRIKQMLESDNDSRSLAMEMLCNINLEKSAFFVLKLIRDYSQNIYLNNSFHHANFKSFRTLLDNFFDTSRKDELFHNNITEDGMIRYMGSARLLTQEHLEELMDPIKNLISNSNPYKRYFQIKNVIATDHLLTLLKNSAENLKQIKEKEELENVED